jgi:beta-lactam-binding protein with PASTA domain
MSFIQFVKSKVFLKQLGFAVVGIIVFAIVVMKWLNISTNHDQKIEVPSLDRMNLTDVEITLKALELRLVVIDSASYNPEYPISSVIDQDPVAGDFVKENRKIYLTLNASGYRNVEIPNVLGKTKRLVSAQLIAIGFRIDSEFIYVSDIAKDVVRGLKFEGENLKEGDLIPQNSLITLKLGDGEGNERYK